MPDYEYSRERIREIKENLKKKKIQISDRSLNRILDRMKDSQGIFPRSDQTAIMVQLLHSYEKSRKKEIIILEELEKKSLPVTIVLGVLAEDWPGMANMILGIVHHKERNVLFMKAFTTYYDEKAIGLVTLCFQIENRDEYREFVLKKKNMTARIKDAAKQMVGKFSLLEGEAKKCQIYNEVVNRIKKQYFQDDLDSIIGKNGEAIQFVASRSHEYLEERKIKDLADLVVENFLFQKSIRNKETKEILKIKNFKTKYEHLTGITFLSREELFSVEDFLNTLRYVVPGHIIKHHKSFVTFDGILVYRIEIVDRDGKALNNQLINRVERSLEKLMITALDRSFSQIKSVGGFEHFARAIIPFLMDEYRRTGINQVYISADKKSDYSIHIRLILVSETMKDSALCQIVTKLEKLDGAEIHSIIPPRHYDDKIEINMLKLDISIMGFSSIKEIFYTIRDILVQVYGEIRDFDEGFREIDMKILNELLDELDDVNPDFIKEVFFNFDEMYRIENSNKLLSEAIKLCSKMIQNSPGGNQQRGVAVKQKNLPELNRTVFVVSYRRQKRLLCQMITKLHGIDVNFTKIQWDDRSYLIMILSRDHSALSPKEIKKIREFISTLN